MGRDINRYFTMVVLLALGVVATGVPAFACYSGLVQIPTTDMLSTHGFSFEQQYDGRLPVDKSDSRLFNSEFGIARNLELGADYDTSEGASNRLLMNAKYRIDLPEASPSSVAIGYYNVGRGFQSTPYVVGSHDFKSLRGHLGGMDINGRNRWFIGIDKAISGRVLVMADYISGRENASSLGVNYQFNERFGVMAGIIQPNTSGSSTRFSLHFVCCGSLVK